MTERIHHTNLPEDMLVCYKPLDFSQKRGEIELVESHEGSKLIKEMSGKWWDASTPRIRTPKNEKPRAFIDGNEISISFSHTKSAICAAMSKAKNVGCDMESVNRVVKPLLIKRIRHPQEPEHLYNDFTLIRIWTLKEASLKMIGTGLRKPMNGIIIKPLNDHLFTVELFNGKRAKICSFQHQEHWISICYQ